MNNLNGAGLPDLTVLTPGRNILPVVLLLLLWSGFIPGTLHAGDNPYPGTATAAAVSPVSTTIHAATDVMARGRVLILGTSDPVAWCKVEAPGTGLSAETDARGYYQIGPVPGNTVLIFSSEGYSSRQAQAGMGAGGPAMPDIYLDRIDFMSDAVIVRAKREKGEAVTTTLSRDEIKRLPGAAGDAIRAVQGLPGVDAPNDYVGQLVIQGGSPADNLYLIDNIPWPFPFHVGGVFSTVNSDILSSVELNSAGFGARWGNILGAVLSAGTRPGKKDRLHFTADISLITSQLLLEGPLGAGDASFTLAGRRSYADLLFGKSIKGFTALPYFWDTGGTLDFTLGPDNRFHAILLGNGDLLKINSDVFYADLGNVYKGEFRIDTGAFTGGFNWINTGIPGFVSTLTLYYYTTLVLDSIGAGFYIDLREYVPGIKEEAVWKAGEVFGIQHEIGFGGVLELTGEKMTANIVAGLLDPGATGFISAYVMAWNPSIGIYLQDCMRVIEPLEITAGVRYDRNKDKYGEKILPRLGLEWRFDESAVFKAAWGYYSQFPSPLETDENMGNTGLKPNLAEHAVASLEKKFFPGLTGRLSAYYKTYNDLVINVQSGQFYANSGSGIAKGLEFFARWDSGERFFAWVSYTLSKSERIGPPSYKWVSYQYDEPNNLTLAASYKISQDWGAGLKLRYATGPLKKRMLGSYKNAFYISDGLYSDTDESRLDDYLRLDLRADYCWRFEGWSLKTYVEVINVLNRANPQGLIYPDGVSGAPVVVNNLPIMPYFGVTAEF